MMEADKAAISPNEIYRLRRLFGSRKKLLDKFELPALLALSHYPKLRDVQIEFRSVKSSIPAFTKVSASTVLLNPWERKYIIHLTEKIKKGREDATIGNATLEMQTAIIGHELAHI